MYYVIWFTRAGAPETGLSPTLDIFRRASDGAVVTPPAITEVGGGLYRFSYSTTVDMAYRVDSNDGTMAAADRYIFGTLGPADGLTGSQIASSVLQATVATYKGTSGSLAQILHYLLRRALGRARKVGTNLVIYDDDGSTVLLTIPITPEEYGPPA